jgi:hypothetical protein
MEGKFVWMQCAYVFVATGLYLHSQLEIQNSNDRISKHVYFVLQSYNLPISFMVTDATPTVIYVCNDGDNGHGVINSKRSPGKRVPKIA